MVTKQMVFRNAQLADAPEVMALINRAYRENEGWTDETPWVEGKRLGLGVVRDLIRDSASEVYVHHRNGVIVAVIQANIAANEAYITSLAVHPYFQRRGIGSAALQALEMYCRNRLGVTFVSASVLAPRQDVLTYLAKRGYQLIDYQEPFPQHLKIGVPKTDNLLLSYLVKSLH